MLYTTVLSALVLAGSAFAQQSEPHYGHIDFTLRPLPVPGPCGRICDGAFTCTLDGKVKKCSGGDARIPADIFYKYYNYAEGPDSPICKSTVHASGFALYEMNAAVCDVGPPSRGEENVEVSAAGEHAQGLTDPWILIVPTESS